MPHGAIRFPFGKCRVCQDHATGVHYGVATCEGCKGFFKRSTMRGEKYKCFFGGECEITPQNRNRCKSCRFRLCLECGMSLEAVKMGRIPKLEKERALELAQRDGQFIRERVNVFNKNGQKNSDSKTIKEESQTPDVAYDSSQTQMEYTSFSSVDDNHPIYSKKDQMPIMSYDSSDSSQSKSDIFYEQGKSGSLSSNDSFNESQSGNLLQEGGNSQKNPWKSQPHYPAPVFESSYDITSLTFSSHPEQGAKMPAVSTQCSSVFKKFQMEFSPFSDSGTHKYPLKRTTDSSVTDSGEYQPGIYVTKSIHNCDPVSSLEFITRPHKESDLQYGTASSTADQCVRGKISPGRAESDLFHHDMRDQPFLADPQYVSSSSSSIESTIWDKEILRKLQLNDYDFKTDFNNSEIYATVRSHYKFLCDVEPGGMFNKLPLYIQTLQQLDICQKNGVLLKLQETPSDMIDKICKTLAMEDKHAISKEGISMGKDSTYLIQGTLQRLKYSMDLLWKPIWLMRQYIRQGLSSMPSSLVFTGDEEADLKETWPFLMASVGFYNDLILGFSFACPGFKNLQNDLKEYLIQRAYFDIWVLTMADFCIDGKCHFPLPNMKIYTNSTMIKILKENTFLEITTVLEKINRCQLCDLEIGLLCVIFLIDADDDKLTSNSSMNLEPLRTLHSHYLDILSTVVSKIHTTQSTKRLKDIFSLTPLIKKLSMRLQLQITLYNVEQIPDEDCLQTIAFNTQATVEKNHTI